MVLRGLQHFCVLELPSPHVLRWRADWPMANSDTEQREAILAFMSEKQNRTVLRTLPKVSTRRRCSRI